MTTRELAAPEIVDEDGVAATAASREVTAFAEAVGALVAGTTDSEAAGAVEPAESPEPWPEPQALRISGLKQPALSNCLRVNNVVFNVGYSVFKLQG